MPTKVFLPLRSNIGWFSEQEAVERFERLLKMHIALFDRLLIEDGTYFFMSDGMGQGFEWPAGPGAIKNYDRTTHKFHTAGGSFGMQVGGKPLMQGNLSFGCNADFMPIIHRAGLEEATYFEWTRRQLTREREELTTKLGDTDLHDNELANTLPDDQFLRKNLLKGFYHDAALSQDLGVPLAVDHHFEGFLKLKHTRDAATVQQNIPLVFLRRWLNMNLPDFSSYRWEQIHELHESPRGEDFRRMVENLTAKVTELMPHSPSSEELRELVSHAFSEVLLRELRPRVATGTGTAVDVALNLIPYGSIASIGKDLAALGRDNTSWISLLRAN